MMKTQSGLEIELKDISLDQRIDANETMIQEKYYAAWVKYCRYGIKSINGVEAKENVDDLLLSLTNNEILEIGFEIAKRANLTPKKKF